MRVLCCLAVVLGLSALPAAAEDAKNQAMLRGEVVDAQTGRPLRPMEVVVGGRVVERITPANRKTEQGGYESPIETSVALDESSWIAVRVFEDRPDRRIRFAHSSPVHVDVPGKPLRPRREEVDYFVRRMKEELQRNQAVLRPDDLKEYREALAVYEDLAERAR